MPDMLTTAERHPHINAFVVPSHVQKSDDPNADSAALESELERLVAALYYSNLFYGSCNRKADKSSKFYSVFEFKYRVGI